MRGVVALLVVGSTGCQLVFELEIPPCSTKARALVDSLDVDTVLWDEIQTTNTINYDAGGVHLVMTVPETTSIRHTLLYDLRESSFAVEVDPTVTLDVNDQISFLLSAPDFDQNTNAGHALQIVRKNTKLVASYFEDGALNEIDALDFDPTAHQIWQVSRHQETTSWAVASAGAEPVVFQTFDLPWATFLAPHLIGTRDLASTSPFTATFRNLNAGAEPDEVCGAEQLIDRFDNDEIDRDTWGRSGAAFEVGCQFGADGGDLAVTFETAGTVSDVCSLGSSGIYDLRSHTFTIEVDANLVASERVTVQIEMPGAANTANFLLANGKLNAITEVNGVDTPARMADYDPTAHRFWRFAGSIGADGRDQLEWSVSDTGRDDDFDFFASAGTIDRLDRVRFNVVVVGDGAETPETRVRFPRVN